MRQMGHGHINIARDNSMTALHVTSDYSTQAPRTQTNTHSSAQPVHALTQSFVCEASTNLITPKLHCPSLASCKRSDT